jgi:hypothetical protein
MTAHVLLIRNPTNLSRPGFITVPAPELRGAGPRDTPFTILDEQTKTTYPTQLDRLHADDPSRDVVSVFIDNIPAHNQDTAQSDAMYLSVRLRQEPDTHSMSLVDEGPGKLLGNDRLYVYVFPPVGPFGWQGGAITSVRVRDGDRQHEMLDAMKAEFGDKDHDQEKRLQVDRVSIANPPWNDAPSTEFKLFEESWQVVGSGAGPVRAFVNLESPGFTFAYGDVEHRCHLYRVISLFRGADFVHDQIYVLGEPSSDGKRRNFAFAAHFFLKMNCGMSARITRVPQIPDWFAIGAVQPPYPGFGSASSVPCGRIDNPPLDYPNYKTEKSAFGWGLDYAREVRCIHLFKRNTEPHAVADETGRRWYDLILKPPRASAVEVE